jgi:hypothetical protein
LLHVFSAFDVRVRQMESVLDCAIFLVDLPLAKGRAKFYSCPNLKFIGIVYGHY